MTDACQKQNMDQLLDEAIAFERKAAEIYAELSRLFSHSLDISAIWDQMRNDELLHADILQNLKTELTREQLFTSADEAIWEKIVSVHQLLGEDLISPIKDLRDAYELAAQLEHSEVNAIFQFMVEAMPSHEQQLSTLFDLNEHLERLYDLGDRLRDEILSNQIPAQHDSQ